MKNLIGQKLDKIIAILGENKIEVVLNGKDDFEGVLIVTNIKKCEDKYILTCSKFKNIDYLNLEEQE